MSLNFQKLHLKLNLLLTEWHNYSAEEGIVRRFWHMASSICIPQCLTLSMSVHFFLFLWRNCSIRATLEAWSDGMEKIDWQLFGWPICPLSPFPSQMVYYFMDQKINYLVLKNKKNILDNENNLYLWPHWCCSVTSVERCENEATATQSTVNPLLFSCDVVHSG